MLDFFMIFSESQISCCQFCLLTDGFLSFFCWFLLRVYACSMLSKLAVGSSSCINLLDGAYVLPLQSACHLFGWISLASILFSQQPQPSHSAPTQHYHHPNRTNDHPPPKFIKFHLFFSVQTPSYLTTCLFQRPTLMASKGVAGWVFGWLRDSIVGWLGGAMRCCGS